MKKGDIEVQQLEGERLRLSSPGEEIFVFASGPVFSSRQSCDQSSVSQRLKHLLLACSCDPV